MKRVLLLKGQSQYNVMRSWTDELAKAFEKLGVEVIILDLMYMKSDFLIHYLNFELDAVLGFNGYLIEDDDFRDYLLKRNIPYIFMLADNPINHTKRIANLRDKDILTVMDRNDFNFFSFYKMKPKNIFFLPHAALEISCKNSCQDSNGKIIYAGTYINPKSYREVWNKSNVIKSICNNTVNRCLYDSENNYIEVFYEEVLKKEIDISNGLNNQWIEILKLVERYIYSYRRERVLSLLTSNNISIDIYGNNWEYSPLYNNKSLEFYPNLNFRMLLSKIKEYQLLLNISSIAYDGGHERIFSALGQGTSVLTNETPFLRENFKDGREIFYYNFSQISSIPNILSEIQNKEEEIDKVAQNGKQVVASKHTFDERAKSILSFYKQVTG